jgi:Kdo2-lipid IVA lauroyltransferase/acyltransferase
MTMKMDLQNRIEYVFYRTLAEVVKILPLRAVQRFGLGLGSLAYYVIPIRKKVTLNNLRLAFPEKTEAERRRIALGSYRNLFCSLLEGLWTVRLTPEILAHTMSMKNGEVLDRALAANKGLIVVGGHFGSWEMMAFGVPFFARRIFTIIAKRQRNPYVDKYVTLIREHLGTRIVMMERAPREVLTALRNNGAVLLLADQSGPQDGLFVKFFGHYTSTHKGPAIFSLRTGAPMMMAYPHRREDGSFFIECELLDTTGIEGSEDEKVRAYTKLHVDALERHIRAHPELWLWMHKRWKHPYQETEADV